MSGGGGRGPEDAARIKVGKRGAACATVKGDTARGGQAHGAPKAAQCLAGKSGNPFESVEDSSTRRKGRGFKDATPTKVEACVAAAASMEEASVKGRIGRGLEDAARTKVGKRGAGCAPVKGNTAPGGQAHGAPKAAQRLAGKSGIPFASVEDSSTTRKGRGFKDATPTKVKTCGAGAVSTEEASVSGGGRQEGSSAARSHAGRNGGATNSVDSDAVCATKGRGVVPVSIPSGRRGNISGDSDSVVKSNSPKRYSSL